MNQGTGKVDMFVDDVDRRYFNSLLAQLAPRFNLEVHAYAQVGNHYHVLVRSLDGRLSQAMHWLGTHYATRFNRRHERVGAFFRGRFTSKIVDDERYLHWLPIYIHLNPVHDGFVTRPEDWRWSSYRAMVDGGRREPWLARGEVGRGMTADEYRRLTEGYCAHRSLVPVQTTDTAQSLHEQWVRPRVEAHVSRIERVVAASFGVAVDEIRCPPTGRSAARTTAIALLDGEAGVARRLIAERYQLRTSQAVANAVRRATSLFTTDARALAARSAVANL